MPRSIVLLAAACIAAALTGCGAKDDGQAVGGSAAGEPLVIGVSIPSADHGWTGGVGWWAEQAIARHGDVEWHLVRANSADQQFSQIKTLMGQHTLDALVVLAHESQQVTPIAEEAQRNGIYVVSVDRGFSKPVHDLYVAGDNAAFGRKSAEYMVEKLGGQGRIVILEGIPGAGINKIRVDAAMEVFDRHDGIEVLDSQPADWQREKAHKVMEAFLVKHPEIDAVWASDDDMALGAEQAIREAGREGDIWILGGAGMKDIVKKVMEGDPLYPADITYPPAMIAAAIHLAVYHLKDGQGVDLRELIPAHLGFDHALVANGEVPEEIQLDVRLITPENAADFYFPESVF